jgi:hypothetical protein
MGSRIRRTFLLWAFIVGAFWVVLNLPRNRGSFKFGTLAGFPWIYYGLSDFDLRALFADIAVGSAVTITVAAACAWARWLENREEPTR